MISRSLATSPLLRVLCALCVLCVNLFSSPARAQNFDKPVTNIDEEVTAFAYAALKLHANGAAASAG